MATANGTTTGGKGPLAQAPDQVKLRPPRARLTSEYVADPAGYAFGDWLRAAPPYVDARTRQFGAAAYEDMLYDETVSASLRALVLGVLSDDISLRPAVDDADDPLYEQSKEVLAEVEDDLNALGKPLVETTHAALLASLAAGSKPGELVFRDEDSKDGGRLVLDRLNLKSRKSLAYVCDAYGNLRGYLAVLPGLGAVQTVTSFSAADPPHNFLPREKFCQWTFDSEDNDPRGRPLLRCVYDAWYNGKIQAAREWLMHLARFGSPTLVGTTPQESEAAALADEAGNPIDPNSVPSPEQVFLNQIIQVRNGGSIVLPWGGTLTALQVANAGDSFFKRIDYADRQISRGILLAVRAVMESKFGSRADSQTAQDVTGLFTRYLKTWCAGVLTRDVIRPMVLYNRGEEAARTLAPYASLSPVEHQDWGTELVAATTAYKGGVIREDQLPSVWERMGLPASTQPAPPPPQPPPQPGTPSGPGNGPGRPPGGQPAPRPPAPPPATGARAPARQRAAVAFAADEAGGRWVTIGAQEGEGGGAHGGVHVFIKDGRILKGPAHMVGRRPEELAGNSAGKRTSSADNAAPSDKVGDRVTVAGARYTVEPLDGDDTFPPAVASYEMREGHLFYTGRDGSEGVVSGTPDAIERWKRDVDEEVRRRPPAQARAEPWAPSHGGEKFVAAARAAGLKAAQTFGVKMPAFTFSVTPDGRGGGDAGSGSVDIRNAHLNRPATLNFPTPGTTEGAHFAAHEVIHQAYSADSQLGKAVAERLAALKVAVSPYGALAGPFENLMEAGAAYAHSPAALRRYAPAVHDLMAEWANRLRRESAAFAWDESEHPRDEIGRFAAAAGAEARRHYEAALARPRDERRPYLKENLSAVYKALKRDVRGYVEKRFPLALDRLAEATGLPRETFEPLRAGLSKLAGEIAGEYRDDVRELGRSAHQGEEPDRALRGQWGPPGFSGADVVDPFAESAEDVVEDFRDSEASRLGVPPETDPGYEAAMAPVEERAAQLQGAIAAVLAATFAPLRPGEKYQSVSFAWEEGKHPRDEIGRFAAAAGAEARRHYEAALARPRDERRAFLKERLTTVYKALKRSIAAYAGKRFDLALNRLAEQTGLPRATFEPLRAGLPDLVDLLASRYKENLNDVRSGKRSGYFGSKDPGDVAAHFRDKFKPPEAHRGDLIDSFGSAAEKVVEDFRDAEGDRLGVPDADKDYEGYEKGMQPVEARAAQLGQAIADVLAFTFDPHRPGEKYESVSFAWEEGKHPRVPAGSAEGGEFGPAAGGGATAPEKTTSGVDSPSPTGYNPPGGEKSQPAGGKVMTGTQGRPVSAIVQDFQDYQASARSLPPDEAKRRGEALRAEMAAALPPLTGVRVAEGERARQQAIRGLGHQTDSLAREAVNQRIMAERSPHMAARAEATERAVAEMRRGLDAVAHITDGDWWARQAGANPGKHLAAALAAHPQARKGA